jgi:hypothetical protein
VVRRLDSLKEVCPARPDGCLARTGQRTLRGWTDRIRYLLRSVRRDRTVLCRRSDRIRHSREHGAFPGVPRVRRRHQPAKLDSRLSMFCHSALVTVADIAAASPLLKTGRRHEHQSFEFRRLVQWPCLGLHCMANSATHSLFFRARILPPLVTQRVGAPTLSCSIRTQPSGASSTFFHFFPA